MRVEIQAGHPSCRIHAQPVFTRVEQERHALRFVMRVKRLDGAWSLLVLLKTMHGLLLRELNNSWCLISVSCFGNNASPAVMRVGQQLEYRLC